MAIICSAITVNICIHSNKVCIVINIHVHDNITILLCIFILMTIHTLLPCI